MQIYNDQLYKDCALYESINKTLIFHFASDFLVLSELILFSLKRFSLSRECLIPLIIPNSAVFEPDNGMVAALITVAFCFGFIKIYAEAWCIADMEHAVFDDVV